MVYKVFTLQTATSFPSLQDYQKSLHAKLKKAKTHDIILSSLGGFAAILYLDTYYGPQVIHRSLDRLKVYCFNKKIDLDEMNKEQQDKAIDKAIASCSFPEHLSTYFTPSPSLKQTEKEELEELYEYFQEALDEKGWHPEEKFFIKALYEKNIKPLAESIQKKLVKVIQENFPHSFREDFLDFSKIDFHSYVATTFNYWSSMLPKPPQLVKAIAADSKSALVGFLSHPFKTYVSVYALHNFLAVCPEILTKLNLIDNDNEWVKKIEKLAKNLSSQSEFFFLKKDRKVHYAIIDILIPILIIYAFYDFQNSINKLGKHRFNRLEKQPFSFSSPKHNLQCLDKESRKNLQKFFQSKKSIANLSGSFKELLMEIVRDFEHFKEIEGLVEKGPGCRFFYLTSDSTYTSDAKKVYLKKLKAEIAKSSSKQQIVLVLDQDCLNNLKDGGPLKDFLEGIEDRKPKILLMKNDKELAFDTGIFPPSYQPDQAQNISLAPSIGELLKKYFEDHPLASIVPEYEDQHFLIRSFMDSWNLLSKKDKEQRGIRDCIKNLELNLKNLGKKGVKGSGANARIQKEYFIKIIQLKKHQRSGILNELKVGDFSTKDGTRETPRYKSLQREYKVLELINERMKNKRKALV